MNARTTGEFLIGSIGAPRLPIEYQGVEYIESTGTQYIDTGYYPNGNTKVVLDFQMINQGEDQQAVFGARGGSDTQFGIFAGYGADCVQTDYYTNAKLNGWRAPINGLDLNQRNVIEVSNELVVNGTVIKTVNTETFSVPYTMYVFTYNRMNDLSMACSMKLYSFKTYDNDMLVRDFIPCYRKSDNVAGLYDAVNGVFYENTGTGTFLVGADVNKEYANINPKVTYTRVPEAYQEIEYLENSGTQYIDMGVTPDQNTRVLCDFSYSTKGYVFGSHNAWADNAFVFHATVAAYNSETANYTINTDERCSVDFNKNVLSVNGTVVKTFTKVTFSNNHNMYLFSSNVAGGPVETMTGKIYFCKVYKNDILVRDLIPCYRKADNVAGMYDLVSKTFFTKVGTGNFTQGANSSLISKNLIRRYVGNKLVYGEAESNYEERFVAVGENGYSYYSLDGETWNLTTNNTSNTSADFVKVLYCKNKYFILTEQGVIYVSEDNGESLIEYSTINLDIGNFVSIAYGLNKFVAITGKGGSCYSEDGINWTEGSGLASGGAFSAMIFGNNKFIAVGGNSRIYYSEDGITWIKALSSGDALYDITYGNKTFVAVGYGSCYYSLDGVSWTKISSLTSNMSAIGYGNGKFIIRSTATTNKFYYSEDGINWTEATSSTFGGKITKSIAYGLDRFVAVGLDGVSCYSLDGLTWTLLTGGISTSLSYASVTCGRKAVPKQQQLVNYTMLYDYGDECNDITGGWVKYELTDDDYLVISKEADGLLHKLYTTSSSSYPRNYGGFKTANEIDFSQYVKFGAITSNRGSGYVYDRFVFAQTDGPTTTDGNIDNAIKIYDYYNDGSTYTTKRIEIMNLAIKSLTKLCTFITSYSFTKNTMTVNAMMAYKQDNWQELCTLAGLTASNYTDESALCSNNTAITTILNNEEAVKFMICNCTGTFMATAVLSSVFLTALNNSPYNTIIQANRHWNKFLAMVA